MTIDDYMTNLVAHLRAYRRRHFVDCDYLFDGHHEPSPPVFTKRNADWNLLLPPGASQDETTAICEAISVSKRHRWFVSMKSSQTLAQSVFANLKERHKMDLLSPLMGDDSQPLFCRQPDCELQVNLEYEVDYLGEVSRGRTNLDVLLEQGSYQIAVECKLSESEFGRCSRPLLKAVQSSYEREYCNGDYTWQLDKRARCSLTAIGVKYWEYVPKLFPEWASDVDQCPCPLNETYQLTRNLLAACVRRSDLSLDTAGGHVVVVYDDRNPAFQVSGEAAKAYTTVKNALLNPALLQKTTWQQVVACLREDTEIAWLEQALADKYGIM